MSDQDPNVTAALPPVDMEKRIEQYVKLRDLKEEFVERHKEELKPIQETLDLLQQELSRGLDSLNVDSVKTSCGTASFTTKSSASIKDLEAFWTYVTLQGLFDLIDKRANVKGVQDFIAQNGAPPPGVNYTEMRAVNVRRKS
jgi:hypothetical protein